jgi:hypothetical protein
MKKKFVQICPQCGSTNVKSIFLISPVELSRPGAKKLKEQISKHPIGAPIIGWQPQNPSVFVCMDCDYNGICPEIDVEEIEKFRKKLKKK